MKKGSKQKLELKLRKRILKVRPLKKDGGVGNWSEWKLRPEKPDSLLPRSLFFTLTHYVSYRVNKIPKDQKSFETLREPIRLGLCEATKACGCEYKLNSKSTLGDVTWRLDDHRFFAFQIIDFQKHPAASWRSLQRQLRERRKKFVEMEEKSRAVFRAAIVVLKGGGWRFVPAKRRT